ncbi:hypothetical protein BGX28_010404 [Mortierella sp. GBA30]|nr:hypothetical protein BGX28_010404 [Mortierella sp. GBA30]
MRCLLEWLEHSNKRYCELCKHSFGFTPIYSPEMPETLPKWMLAKKAVDTLAIGIRIILRAILVATIWLVILPYFTIWIWRLYFWVGDWFAFSANGLGVPIKGSANITASNNVTESLLEYEQTDSFTRFVHRTISPEYSWFSKFVLDCFDGQIVSAVVVVVFVAVFLLREWVLQNQDPEGEDIPVVIPEQAAGDEVFQAFVRLREAHLREQEEAEEEAARVLALERETARELARQVARNEGAHMEDILHHNSQAFMSHLPQNPIAPTRESFWESEFESITDSELSSLPEETHPHYNGATPTSRPGYIYDPLNQTYHPNKELLFWREGIPLTHENVFLRPDGAAMALDEKIARYEELCQTGDLCFRDGVKLLEWRSEQAEAQMQQIALRRADMTLEERAQRFRELELGTIVMEQHRDDLLRQTQERVQARIQNARADRAHRPVVPRPPLRPAAPRPPAPVAAAAAAAAAAPPPPPPPLAAPVEAADDIDDMNGEELDGILEVIGMRGSYWLLLQNSLLMSALICATLGLGVLIPYMLGKTMLLVSPFNIVRIPLRILSRLTDPITDFIIDRIMPLLGLIVLKPLTVVSSYISPHLSSTLEPYLGSQTLKPLEDLIHAHVAPLLNSVVEEAKTSAPSHAQQAVQDTGASELPMVLAQTSLLQQFNAKWNDLAYGTSSDDMVLATVLGYVILFAAASWYMNKKHSSHGHTVGRLVRDILRQLGLIMKIAFFVAIEMVAFPLFCGVVVGFTTLPLLPGATIASRWAFYLRSPNWSLVMHWLVGTAFMFNFSLFVSISRTVVRPGVMWFIRDPNDDGFHPVREILERPVLVQLRKLGTGVLMYLTLILLGVSLNVHGVNLLLKGILPLRWPVDEPLSDLPIDMLVFHLLMPLTFRWIDPTHHCKVLFEKWWCWLARMMRLSSFMYGKEGQRYPVEEGYFEYRTWKAWLLRQKPPIPGTEGGDVNAVGSGEELDIDAPVIFVRDGGLYRVPNTDRVVHLKGRRVLVPVDENGRALDPKEDLPGEIDPLMEILPRGREPQPPIDPTQGTVVVYAPPNFKRRLISFIAIIWTSTTSFMAVSVVAPLYLGRILFAAATARQVHDVYSFVTGVYTISALWRLQEWAFSAYETFSSQRVVSIDVKTYFRTVWNFVKLVAKAVYFAVVFGVLFPLALGLLMELVLIIPLRAAVRDETGVIFSISWAVGLLYMKIIHRVLSAFPNNRFTIDMNRVFVGTDIAEWDVVLATRHVILPAAGLCLLAIGCPAVLAWTVSKTLNLEGVSRIRFFRLSYPTVFFIFLIAIGFKESVTILKGWSQYVRDQKYLVGRRLHNLTEEDENAPDTDAAQDPQLTANGDDQVNLGALEINQGDVYLRQLERSTILAYKDNAEDNDMPDLEPVTSYDAEQITAEDSRVRSSISIRRQSHDGYPSLYGARSYRSDPEEEADEDDIIQSYLDYEAGESSGTKAVALEESEIGSENEDMIAARTRFRRNQRLQATRSYEKR